MYDFRNNKIDFQKMLSNYSLIYKTLLSVPGLITEVKALRNYTNILKERIDKLEKNYMDQC